jgi:DNA-nicking Smr family endonuclease
MSGSRRLRLLTAQEIELWRSVAQTVEPRQGSTLPQSTPVEAPLQAPAAPAAKSAKPRPKSIVAPYSPPQSRPRSGPLPLAPIEPKYRKKVARGQVGIERVMDLHGLNQAEAHSALRGFLRLAQADRLRLVLVVTGKGQRAYLATPDRDAGVLKRSVPNWLREHDLRDIVLGFEEASQGHGGAGALYVRLRSRRTDTGD